MSLRAAGQQPLCDTRGFVSPLSSLSATPLAVSFHQLLDQLGNAHDRELEDRQAEILHLKHALEVRDQEIEACRKENRQLSSRSHSEQSDVKVIQSTVDTTSRSTNLLRAASWPRSPRQSPNDSVKVESASENDAAVDGPANGPLPRLLQSMTMTTFSSYPSPAHPKDGDTDFIRQVSDESEYKHQATIGKAALMLTGCDPVIFLPVVFHAWNSYVNLLRKPVKFTVWPELEETSFQPDGSAGRMLRADTISHESERVVQEITAMKYNKYCGHLLVQPGSNFRITWDLIGTLFLAWDIIMIPLSAFGPERDGLITVMEWTTLLFWSGDMFMSCVTGVVVKGVTMMEPMVILKNYLKSWFILDVLVVVPDWVFTIMSLANGPESKGGAASSGKLLRALRVLRTIRLLRLAKLQRILMLLRDCIESEMTFIIVNILRLVSMLLMLNHFLAAIWYSIGTIGKDRNGPNWIDSVPFSEGDVAYKYLTSLHWSICMFTPGSMSVQPQNVGERLFAILILVCGLVAFTAFISSVTASVAQLRSLQGDKGKTLWMLRRFLRQHDIRKSLSFRVLRYVENALREQKGKKVPISKVSALEYLSEQLRKEVTYDATYSCLCLHPVCERMESTSKVTMLRLVGCALSQKPLAPNDMIFSYGGNATHMHIVNRGELTYSKRLTMNSEGDDDRAVNGDWLCEPILWVRWAHQGDANAVTTTDLVCIQSDRFLEVVGMDLDTMHLLCMYASKYADYLSSLPKGLLTDISTQSESRTLSLDMLTEGMVSARASLRTSQIYPATSNIDNS